MNPVQKQKQEAAAVKEMMNTTGWEIISKFLVDEAKTLHTKYLDAVDSSAEERMAKYDERAIRKLIEKINGYASIR